MSLSWLGDPIMIVILTTLTFAMAEVPKTIPLPHIRGKELYDDLCFQCHGTVGLADTPLAVSMNAPKLAGQFTTGEYAADIKLVQEGKGLMPSYEMVIDKHDTKRILIYLGGLDPETGIDPRIKEETEESKEDSTESKKPSNKIQKSSSVPEKPKKPALKKSSSKKMKPKLKEHAEEKSEKKSETIP
jgi:hypothetical protein